MRGQKTATKMRRAGSPYGMVPKRRRYGCKRSRNQGPVPNFDFGLDPQVGQVWAWREKDQTRARVLINRDRLGVA